MGKRKCKFMDELNGKYSCSRSGRDEWEAELLVRRLGTYVFVANKDAPHLRAFVECEKRKKAVGR
jgi:hypothetical protein